MRYLPQVLCFLGLISIAFGYWGINTVAGRRRFDEMAGMIPLVVGGAGLVLIVGGGIWLLLRSR